MAKILTKTKLSEHKYETPEGYLICQDAVLARTGKQEYLKSEVYPTFDGIDGPIMVDRKPEQVFAAETMASFEDKPITVEHPDESVNPENYSELAVGHTRNIRKGTYNGQDVMIADLVITDAQTIEDIKNGIRTELSCGYDCDITEGDNPEQINIRGNHVALCEQGRAGIAKIIDSKTIIDADLRLDLRIKGIDKDKVTEYLKDKYKLDVTDDYVFVIDVKEENLKSLAKELKSKFDIECAARLVAKTDDAAPKKSLEAKDKRQLSNYLASVSKHMSNDLEISDIIKPIEEMGFKPVREKIDGWDKMDDGYYRKDYYFSLDGYADQFMVSLYAKGNGDWEVNEVNAYFIGKVKDSIDLVKYIDSALLPEKTYEDENTIIAQFASYGDAKRAIKNSNISNLGYNISDDESAVFVIYNKDDILNFIGKPIKEESKPEYDNSRYIIFAKGTWDNGRALFWIGDHAEYRYEWDAPKFTKAYAEKVESFQGKYDWMKKEVKNKVVKDSKEKYVVYREGDIIYGTPYENYISKIRDKSKITTFEQFDNLNKVVEYLLKYTDLSREEIVTTEFVIDDSATYRTKFYEKSKKYLEKQLKKLEELDDKIKDDDERELYNKQKYKIHQDLKENIKACEKNLNEEAITKDSDPLSLNIKSWYMSEYPTDEVGETLDDDVTFQDLFDCLDSYKDVYELLGGDADSIVRERCFEKLAELIDCDYDYIYDQWLKCNE